MNLIAIETSIQNGGVVLSISGRIVGERRFSHQDPASQELIPAISSLLDTAGLGIQQVDCFAVTVGPGSFTGLRVGLTAAKTLAYFNDKAVIGVPTLDVLAHPFANSGKTVVSILDARKGEVYGAVYRTGPGIELISEYRVCRVEEILPDTGEILVVGDAIPLYKSRILSVRDSGCELADESAWRPDSCSLADLALTGQYASLTGKNLFTLAPVYLRKSEAEVQWDRKHGSNSR